MVTPVTCGMVGRVISLNKIQLSNSAAHPVPIEHTAFFVLFLMPVLWQWVKHSF